MLKDNDPYYKGLTDFVEKKGAEIQVDWTKVEPKARQQFADWDNNVVALFKMKAPRGAPRKDRGRPRDTGID